MCVVECAEYEHTKTYYMTHIALVRVTEYLV